MNSAELMAITETIKLANRIIDANPKSAKLMLGLVDRVLKGILGPLSIMEKLDFEKIDISRIVDGDKLKNMPCVDCGKVICPSLMHIRYKENGTSVYPVCIDCFDKKEKEMSKSLPDDEWVDLCDSVTESENES